MSESYTTTNATWCPHTPVAVVVELVVAAKGKQGADADSVGEKDLGAAV